MAYLVCMCVTVFFVVVVVGFFFSFVCTNVNKKCSYMYKGNDQVKGIHVCIGLTTSKNTIAQ